MNHVLRVPWLIAGNTVRELVRSKLLHNLLLFAVLLIASSMFVAQLTIGQWDRVILDIGLAAIEVSGVLVAVLMWAWHAPTLFDRYGYGCALYGHFGQGCIWR